MFLILSQQQNQKTEESWVVKATKDNSLADLQKQQEKREKAKKKSSDNSYADGFQRLGPILTPNIMEENNQYETINDFFEKVNEIFDEDEKEGQLSENPKTAKSFFNCLYNAY